MALVSKTFSDIITFTRASTGSYFDSAGVLQSAAINAPRLDYNPSTLAAQGLLIEEQRTNSIRNNTMVGASAGVAPTNWTQWNVTVNGVTIASSAAGTENGIAYIDVAVSGTCTLSGTAQTPAFESSTQIAATIGQTWTESVYWTLVSGSLADSSFSIRISETDAGGTSLVSGDGTTIVPAVGNLRSARYTHTRTLTNASTAFVVPRLRFGFVNGTTYSFTLRVGLPQMEQGAFATSVIPTTTAAVTRSADVASVNTLSPWFNATEGTLYAEAVSTGYVLNTNFPIIASLDDGTANNRITAFQGASSVSATLNVRSASVNTTIGDSGVDLSSAVTKLVGAFSGTSVSVSVNGNASIAGTTNGMPAGLTTMRIGSSSGLYLSSLNGYLRRITYYPRRLSNAELQTITA